MAKLLVLSFFPAFTPASSGGELRLGDLYRAVSEFHDVTMLTSTDFTARFEEVRHTSRFLEMRFPKDKLWRQAYGTLERLGVFGDLSGLAFALAVSDPSCQLRETALEIASDVDYIIHEFPFSEPIFAEGAPRPEVYNSHNFELGLLPSIVYGNGFEAAFLKLMRLESNLVGRSQLVFAASSGDAERFRLVYGVDCLRLALCPNGFNDADLSGVAAARMLREAKNERPKLLFMASGHHPNVDGALFLIQIATALPQCDVILAGGVSTALSAQNIPENVILLGPFDEAAKRRLLINADLILNPVTLGSGTSLKAIEALGAGVPMISTPEGSRGLGLVHNEHAILVSRDCFVPNINWLLSNPHQQSQLAAAGKDLARNYTWRKIAAGFIAKLAAPSSASTSDRSLVLALNDYPVPNTHSGGSARIRNIHLHLGNDTVLVTLGQNWNFDLISPHFLHITVPKAANHQAYEAAVNSGQIVTVNDGVASLFAASNRLLGAIAFSIVRRAQAVVFEHPYMAPLLEGIRQVRPNVPVIYSSHNIEKKHKAALLRGHKAGDVLLRFISDVEDYAVSNADLVVCCTESDREHFDQSHPETIIAANGCLVPDIALLRSYKTRSTPEDRPRVGFLGSSHGPNVEALRFIIDYLAPLFPNVIFEVIGSVCSAVPISVLTNVVMLGVVEEEDKTRIMDGWTLALNPLQSGGGSSLKLPDFMAHALPTINTPAGARGFDVGGHDAGFVVERSAFAAVLSEALGNPDLLERQSANAYSYAHNELSWSACTREYGDRLRRLIRSKTVPTNRPERSLLIVTYRYTEPPLGGAEEYLIEVLKQLRPRFDRIDLAAIDIGQITNAYHFSTSVSNIGQGATVRIGELFDSARYFVPDELPNDVVERCRQLERAWMKDEQVLFAPFAEQLSTPDRMHLFAGFFWPENHGGTIRRWTSPEFSFLIPPGARVFRMTGYAASEKKLRVTLARVSTNGAYRRLAQTDVIVPSWFSRSFTLPATEKGEPLVVLCTVDEHDAESDQRPLGILLEQVSVLMDRTGSAKKDGKGVCCLEEIVADLAEEKETDVRTNRFQQWVAALHDAGIRHSDLEESNFAAVPGTSLPLNVDLA